MQHCDLKKKSSWIRLYKTYMTGAVPETFSFFDLLEWYNFAVEVRKEDKWICSCFEYQLEGGCSHSNLVQIHLNGKSVIPGKFRILKDWDFSKKKKSAGRPMMINGVSRMSSVTRNNK